MSSEDNMQIGIAPEERAKKLQAGHRHRPKTVSTHHHRSQRWYNKCNAVAILSLLSFLALSAAAAITAVAHAQHKRNITMPIFQHQHLTVHTAAADHLRHVRLLHGLAAFLQLLLHQLSPCHRRPSSTIVTIATQIARAVSASRMRLFDRSHHNCCGMVTEHQSDRAAARKCSTPYSDD